MEVFTANLAFTAHELTDRLTVNGCWSSPVQWFSVPSLTGLMAVFYCLTALGSFRPTLFTNWWLAVKLLLALASTVIFGFDSRGPHDHILLSDGSGSPQNSPAATHFKNCVKVKVTLRLTVGQSVSLGVEPHLGHVIRYVLVWQLRSGFCGAPSLTRGRVCLLCMLLVLASAVFLGSESLGSRDHILLSQFWGFPFRRLLRLAGSPWRYSTPPPHGWGHAL
jgi:hypothetical protein